MDRRTVIKQITLLTGAAFIGGEVFIQSGCKSSTDLFSSEQIAFLDEIGDVIIPETTTPGAKSINIGTFMSKMVASCYSPDQQKIFIAGMEEINKEFDLKYNLKFEKATQDLKTSFLNEVNEKMAAYQKNKKEKDPNHYFLMMKQLTILGFFTSETGATKTLRYEAVPGRYDGSYPYKKGDRAWAT